MKTEIRKYRKTPDGKWVESFGPEDFTALTTEAEYQAFGEKEGMWAKGMITPDEITGYDDGTFSYNGKKVLKEDIAIQVYQVPGFESSVKYLLVRIPEKA